MADPRTPSRPTPEQCALVLRAARIAAPLVSCDFLPMPEYSPNIIAIVNGRYVLRASTFDGAARFARERRALASLRALPSVPRVLGAGTFALDWEAHYLLQERIPVQERIPGHPVFPLWLELGDEARARLVAGLVSIIRPVHRLAVPTYAIGHFQGALRDWRGGWLDGHDLHMRHLLARVRARALTVEQARLVAEAEGYYAAHRTALAYSGGPRFAHGDLHLYNVPAAEGQVTGIIDWEWAYGGGTEPDFDLDALIRWAIYPRGIAEVGLEERVTGADFAALIPALLAAYPEVRAIPRLGERITIYQIEHELQQIAAWPPRVPREPVRRLHGWVHERPLAPYLT